MEWTDLLCCPKTEQSLHFDEAASVLRGEASGVAYPVIDGILRDVPAVSGMYVRISAN